MPETCGSYVIRPIRKRIFAQIIKHFEMKRLFWISGSAQHTVSYLLMRHRGILNTEKKVLWRWNRERFNVLSLMIRIMWLESKECCSHQNLKEVGVDSSPDILKEICLYQHLGSSLEIMTLDAWPSELWVN